MQLIVTIALVFAALPVGTLAVLLHIRKKTQSKIDAVFQYLNTPSPNDPIRFTHELIHNTPEPAKRYLVHALQDCPSCPAKVTLFMDGIIFLEDKRLGHRILKTKSRFLITSRRGYALRGFSPPRHHLQEYYSEDRGEKTWTTMQIWPGKKHQGDETSRSLRQKFALHLIWLPSALLPQFGTIWKSIDENHAVAKLIIDNEPIDVTLTIDTDGRLKSAWLTRRTSPEKALTYLLEVEKEDSFNAVTIPSQVRIYWQDESGQGVRNKIAQLNVSKASFQ